MVRLRRDLGDPPYGAGHLIDILRGADTARIRERGHNRLTTYGIGTDLDAAGWRSVIRQLVASGIIAPQGDYGVLTLTDKSGPVLRGETTVMLRTDPARSTTRSTRSSRSAPDLADSDRGLFEHLRGWRKAEASRRGVPPYVVFNDATLRELATMRPTSASQLRSVSGIGDAKLEQYGEDVLTAISDFDSESEPA